MLPARGLCHFPVAHRDRPDSIDSVSCRYAQSGLITTPPHDNKTAIMADGVSCPSALRAVSGDLCCAGISQRNSVAHVLYGHVFRSDDAQSLRCTVSSVPESGRCTVCFLSAAAGMHDL